MHFQTIVSIAILACATHVAAQAQPYKLIKGPVLGISLARRSTNGYQPEQSTCGDGDTCAEACGKGYEACPSNDDSTHCFNPAVKQSCCTDGSGNSCDEGYYCTHDTKAQTWCCPDTMDLVQCAAIYGVEDRLEAATAQTSSIAETTTTAAETTYVETTSVETTSVEPTTTSAEPTSETTSAAIETEPTTTSIPETTSTKVTSTEVIITSTSEPATTKTKMAVSEKTSIYSPPASSGYSTAWSGSNSTIASAKPAQPSETAVVSVDISAPTTPAQATGNSAATTGASVLLIAVAGAFALL